MENVNSAYALYDVLNQDALNQSQDIHKKALLICSAFYDEDSCIVISTFKYQQLLALITISQIQL
ncbi:hypothetical protein B9T24_05965 [Acinetobacter sp. ANC 4654]|nr:hypothetical protein B9T24_05965 [Acinetobacter sp. ANC 4654]